MPRLKYHVEESSFGEWYTFSREIQPWKEQSLTIMVWDIGAIVPLDAVYCMDKYSLLVY